LFKKNFLLSRRQDSVKASQQRWAEY